MLVVDARESRCEGGRPAIPSRASAASIISRATVSMFCSSQPCGSLNCRGQHVAAPAVDRLAPPRPAAVRVAAHARRTPHQALERIANVGQVERLGRRARPADSPAAARERSSASSARPRDAPCAGMRAVDQPFQQAVRRQAIRAVQAAGGDFAGRPQAGQRRAAFDDRPSRRRSCSARRAAPESDRG